MKRRTFTALALAAAFTPGLAAADGWQAYAPGSVEALLADGQTVFVDYAADWCSTCARQERVIDALRAENPAYDEAMVFVRVDWDDYQNAAIRTDRNIPRRSTLLVLRGDQELGRIVAGTSQSDIQALLNLGL